MSSPFSKKKIAFVLLACSLLLPYAVEAGWCYQTSGDVAFRDETGTTTKWCVEYIGPDHNQLKLGPSAQIRTFYKDVRLQDSPGSGDFVTETVQFGALCNIPEIEQNGEGCRTMDFRANQIELSSNKAYKLYDKRPEFKKKMPFYLCCCLRDLCNKGDLMKKYVHEKVEKKEKERILNKVVPFKYETLEKSKDKTACQCDQVAQKKACKPGDTPRRRRSPEEAPTDAGKPAGDTVTDAAPAPDSAADPSVAVDEGVTDLLGSESDESTVAPVCQTDEVPFGECTNSSKIILGAVIATIVGLVLGIGIGVGVAMVLLKPSGAPPPLPVPAPGAAPSASTSSTNVPAKK